MPTKKNVFLKTTVLSVVTCSSALLRRKN